VKSVAVSMSATLSHTYTSCVLTRTHTQRSDARPLCSRRGGGG
jgi:hypothetical protein